MDHKPKDQLPVGNEDTTARPTTLPVASVVPSPARAVVHDKDVMFGTPIAPVSSSQAEVPVNEPATMEYVPPLHQDSGGAGPRTVHTDHEDSFPHYCEEDDYWMDGEKGASPAIGDNLSGEATPHLLTSLENLSMRRLPILQTVSKPDTSPKHQELCSTDSMHFQEPELVMAECNGEDCAKETIECEKGAAISQQKSREDRVRHINSLEVDANQSRDGSLTCQDIAEALQTKPSVAASSAKLTHALWRYGDEVAEEGVALFPVAYSTDKSLVFSRIRIIVPLGVQVNNFKWLVCSVSNKSCIFKLIDQVHHYIFVTASTLIGKHRV
jgi:hypothetical protein